MQTIAKAVSAVALVGTIAPSILFFSGAMELATMKGWMLAATVLWFIATPLWMDRKVKG
jgi:TM2 domain-containing membrane protein YozV